MKQTFLRALLMFPLLLVSAQASAKLITLTGTFNIAEFSAPPPSAQSLTGSWSLEYDDASVLPGDDFSLDVPLTSLVFSPGTMADVFFDLTNSGGNLRFENSVFRGLTIGGLASGGANGFESDTPDFLLGYSVKDSDLRSIAFVFPPEAGGALGVNRFRGEFAISSVEVPEPATLGLLGLGLIGLGFAKRRMR